MVTGADEAPDPALVEALEAARDRPPWTVDAVMEHAERPAAGKASWETCQDCPAPCAADEVCATVIVHELGLLDEVGRAQAYRLVESGMRRLRGREGASLRSAGEHRPDTFVRLTADEEPDDPG